MIAVGLMSGTSLDGIDAALVRIVPRERAYALDLLGFRTVPFDADLCRALAAALPPEEGSVAEVAALHRALGVASAQAVRSIAGDAEIGYVASHGQTLWHDGSRQLTLQVGDAFAIRESVRATVCYDFRSGDCAAGGHGAPLLPYVDALLLRDASEDRVALNIGGIANVTLLPCNGALGVSGFDTGPGNMLVDEVVRAGTGGAQAFDRDGALAAHGTVDEALLAAMLSDEYFSTRAPKTTGRERFGSQFLARYRERLGTADLRDAAATLTELTAASIARAIAGAGFSRSCVIVSGGGSKNKALLARLAALLPSARLERSDRYGLPADAKEAMAFAVLGYETLRGRAANVPAVTGARAGVPLGAIAPYELASLLRQVEAECLSS